MVLVPEGQHDRSLARSACSLDIFWCEFQSARRANRKQPRGSALGTTRPRKAPCKGVRMALTTTYRRVVICDGSVPFTPDCPGCLPDKNSAGASAFLRKFGVRPLGTIADTRPPLQG